MQGGWDNWSNFFLTKTCLERAKINKWSINKIQWNAQKGQQSHYVCSLKRKEAQKSAGCSDTFFQAACLMSEKMLRNLLFTQTHHSKQSVWSLKRKAAKELAVCSDTSFQAVCLKSKKKSWSGTRCSPRHIIPSSVPEFRKEKRWKSLLFSLKLHSKQCVWTLKKIFKKTAKEPAVHQDTSFPAG